MQKKTLKRSGAVVLSLAAAAFALAPSATAAPGAELVTFGDSFTANPHFVSNTVSKNNLPADLPVPPVDVTDGCAQGPNNWPRHLANGEGLSLADYSCTAGTSRTALDRLDRAIQNGAIGASTRYVVSMIGGNDYGGFGAISNGIVPVKEEVQRAYSENMDAFVHRIREVAPNAEIILAGYPEVAAGDRICMVQVAPNDPAGIDIPMASTYQEWMREQSIASAERHGLKFVDNLNYTRGHNTCAPADIRHVAGAVDTETDWNMQLHPTDLGSRELARHIGAQM